MMKIAEQKQINRRVLKMVAIYESDMYKPHNYLFFVFYHFLYKQSSNLQRAINYNRAMQPSKLLAFTII